MDYEVLKPFKSTNRRFAPGDGPGSIVGETDDISPHTIGSLRAKSFIGPKNEMVSEPVAPPTNQMSTDAASAADPISK